jgi:hypothetical protein
MIEKCQECGHVSGSYYLAFGLWLCRNCYGGVPASCRLHEYGQENPMDPKGSTAHVRDIKARRLDPKTKKMFYYETPKTYFFPKEAIK